MAAPNAISGSPSGTDVNPSRGLEAEGTRLRRVQERNAGLRMAGAGGEEGGVAEAGSRELTQRERGREREGESARVLPSDCENR